MDQPLGILPSPSDPCSLGMLQLRESKAVVGTIHNLHFSHRLEGLSRGMCSVWVGTMGQKSPGSCAVPVQAYCLCPQTMHPARLCSCKVNNSAIRASTELFNP